MGDFTLCDHLRSFLSPCVSCLGNRKTQPDEPSITSQSGRFFSDPATERLLDDTDYVGAVTDEEDEASKDRRREADVWSLRSDFGKRRRGEGGGHGASRWDLIKAWWRSAGWRRSTLHATAHDDDIGTSAFDPPAADEAIPADSDAPEVSDAAIRAATSSAPNCAASSSASTASRGVRPRISDLELVNPSLADAALAQEERALADEEEARLRKERRRARRKARELGLMDGVSTERYSKDGSEASSSFRRRRHLSPSREGSEAPASPLTGSETSRRRKKKKSRSSQASHSSARSPTSLQTPSDAPALFPTTGATGPDPLQTYYAWCAAYAEAYGAPVDEATAGWLWAQANAAVVSSPVIGEGSGEAQEMEGQAEVPDDVAKRLGLPATGSVDFLKALKATKRSAPTPPGPSASANPTAVVGESSDGEPSTSVGKIWQDAVSGAVDAAERGVGEAGEGGEGGDEGPAWGRWRAAVVGSEEDEGSEGSGEER